jgi:hypothetical protein
VHVVEKRYASPLQTFFTLYSLFFSDAGVVAARHGLFGTGHFLVLSSHALSGAVPSNSADMTLRLASYVHGQALPKISVTPSRLNSSVAVRLWTLSKPYGDALANQ